MNSSREISSLSTGRTFNYGNTKLNYWNTTSNTSSRPSIHKNAFLNTGLRRVSNLLLRKILLFSKFHKNFVYADQRPKARARSSVKARYDEYVITTYTTPPPQTTAIILHFYHKILYFVYSSNRTPQNSIFIKPRMHMLGWQTQVLKHWYITATLCKNEA